MRFAISWFRMPIISRVRTERLPNTCEFVIFNHVLSMQRTSICASPSRWRCCSWSWPRSVGSAVAVTMRWPFFAAAQICSCAPKGKWGAPSHSTGKWIVHSRFVRYSGAMVVDSKYTEWKTLQLSVTLSSGQMAREVHSIVCRTWWAFRICYRENRKNQQVDDTRTTSLITISRCICFCCHLCECVQFIVVGISVTNGGRCGRIQIQRTRPRTLFAFGWSAGHHCTQSRSQLLVNTTLLENLYISIQTHIMVR